MKRNFVYTVLLSLINILFPVITFPYASRILGPAGIGKAQFILSFAQYFSLFAALGIPIYGVTQAARLRNKPEQLALLFGELSLISFVTGLLVSAVYVSLMYSLPYFTADRSLYLMSGLLILFTFCYSDWYYAGLEAFRTITLRSVSVKIICLLLLFFTVKNDSDYNRYLLIMVISIIGNQLFSFAAIARKSRFRWKALRPGQHYKPLLYIFGASIAASMYTMFDAVLLGLLSDNTSVGLYTASMKLVRLIIPLVTAMGVIAVPGLSKNFADGEMDQVEIQLKKSFQFIVFIAVPAGAGIALLAPEWVLLFSGEKFLAAIPAMQFAAFLPLLVGFGHFFCFQILIPAGRNREIFLSMLTGVLIFLAGNLLLVPVYRASGAAAANLITELFVTLMYWYFVNRFFKLRYNWKFLLQSIAASAFFIPLISAIRYFLTGTLAITGLSIVACAGVYFIIQVYLFRNTFLISFIEAVWIRFRSRQTIS
jgi:O-antigen/teichoic acid export membrane protein